jgi:Rrf2 family protein
MHVTAKADYAVRAIVELAAGDQGSPRKVEELANAQDIPLSFLENILTQLRSAGIVRSQRGPEGGYWLAEPADRTTLATVIRAVEGPLVGVRGQRPEEVEYAGSAEALQQVWIALRANLRAVLEHVTVADVAAGKLPKQVTSLTRSEDAWQRREARLACLPGPGLSARAFVEPLARRARGRRGPLARARRGPARARSARRWSASWAPALLARLLERGLEALYQA